MDAEERAAYAAKALHPAAHKAAARKAAELPSLAAASAMAALPLAAELAARASRTCNPRAVNRNYSAPPRVGSRNHEDYRRTERLP